MAALRGHHRAAQSGLPQPTRRQRLLRKGLQSRIQDTRSGGPAGAQPRMREETKMNQKFKGLCLLFAFSVFALAAGRTGAPAFS